MKTEGKYLDLTGNRYGRLVVQEVVQTNTRKTYWLCLCDCGNTKKARSDSLKCDAIQSCGCMKREQDRSNLTKHHRHKESRTRIYTEWQGMKGRCLNPNDPSYQRWGGRGITVCEEWRDSYEAFRDWALKNGYNPNLSIDRIDNDGNYEPSNCRWETSITQARNRRKRLDNTSGYVGVNYNKSMKKWQANITVDREFMHLGTFSKIEDAAKARKEAELKYWGKDA